MKSIIILLIMVGIIFIAVGYVKANQMCPPPVIQYRYYPKTFEQEQEEPVAVSVLCTGCLSSTYSVSLSA